MVYHKAIKLLLIEDSPDDTLLIMRTLSGIKQMEIGPICVDRLSSAFSRLDAENIDIILTDLGLPDGKGIGTLHEISKRAPDVPIIVLTGVDDEELAVEAVRAGAQDYLVKGQIDGNLLMRSIRYSIERHRLMQELRSISVKDELTGLYNRRGFLMLAQKQLEIASRVGKSLWLLYLDIDSMKWINDTLGHPEGDSALKDAASILKQTFREADVIARIGGDEFAVIALEDSKEGAESMIARISENITKLNETERRPYTLSISIGAVPCEANTDCDINALLSVSDKLMYEQKAMKKRM